jgi:hypothetical protein
MRVHFRGLDSVTEKSPQAIPYSRVWLCRIIILFVRGYWRTLS